MNAAYWISPKGEIIYVKTNHISEVISKPEKFGFTSEFIEYIYSSYNEKLGQEGKAREQLMLALFNKGWIRIRKYKTFWSINLSKFAGKAKSYIIQWAKKILLGIHGFKEDDQYAVVKIDQKDKSINTTDIKSLLQLSESVIDYLVERDIMELDDLETYDIVHETLNRRMLFMDYIKRTSL